MRALPKARAAGLLVRTLPLEQRQRAAELQRLDERQTLLLRGAKRLAEARAREHARDAAEARGVPAKKPAPDYFL